MKAMKAKKAVRAMKAMKAMKAKQAMKAMKAMKTIKKRGVRKGKACRTAARTEKEKIKSKEISAAIKIIRKMEEVDWVPLESNPEMLNEFASRVGTPKGWAFVDVLGIDAEILATVPQPCMAVTLLFQLSRKLERCKKQQQARIKACGQVLSADLFFMQQYVGNACGTIATIHCLANSAQNLDIKPTS